MSRHPEFQYRLNSDGSRIKKGHLIRDVFLGSHWELENPMLRRL